MKNLLPILLIIGLVALPMASAACWEHSFTESNGVCTECPAACKTCNRVNSVLSCTSCYVSSFLASANIPGNSGVLTCYTSPPCASGQVWQPNNTPGAAQGSGQCQGSCTTGTPNWQNVCTGSGLGSGTGTSPPCSSSQFLSGGSCFACNTNCLTCSGSATACTSCTWGSWVQNGGTTSNPNTLVTGTCGTTFPCATPFINLNNVCVTNCPAGTQANQNKVCVTSSVTCGSHQTKDAGNNCIDCPGQCATCQFVGNVLSCVTCYQGTFRVPLTGGVGTCTSTYPCSAPTALFQPATLDVQNGLGTCVASCSTVPLTSPNYQGVCITGGTGYNPGGLGSGGGLICHSSCATCSGTAANQCLTCYGGWFQINSGANINCYSPNPCVAPTPNYDPLTHTCTLSCSGGYTVTNNVCTAPVLGGGGGSSCDASCATCSGSAANQCLTCYVGWFKIVNGASITCWYPNPCPATGLTPNYDPATNSCRATCSVSGQTPTNNVCGTTTLGSGGSTGCDASCATCSGPASNQCLTCYVGWFRLTAGAGFTCSYPNPCAFPSPYYNAATNSCVGICPNGAAGADNICPGAALGGGGGATCSGNTYATSATTCATCDGTCATCNGGGPNDCLTCYGWWYYRASNKSCQLSCPPPTVAGGSPPNSLTCTP